jgi:hypothetical protein
MVKRYRHKGQPGSHLLRQKEGVGFDRLRVISPLLFFPLQAQEHLPIHSYLF